ncbi:MAG TPA: hypothetical protein VFE94_03700 [Candidatus Paceibacterota bacterium]|nr:hypothetical protein [Candidatus Paceibacterota bacterium]
MPTQKVLLIILAILVFVSAFFWLVVLRSDAPAGWERYSNNQLGFQINHPAEMEVTSLPESEGATFSLSGNEEQSIAGFARFSDGIQLTVTRQLLSGEPFLDVVNAKNSAAELIQLGNAQGYTYESTNIVGDGIVLILVEAPQDQFFEISYNVQDPNGRGYQQIVDQAAASFEILESGVPFALTIVFGIIILAGIALGAGLLFISRPT